MTNGLEQRLSSFPYSQEHPLGKNTWDSTDFSPRARPDHQIVKSLSNLIGPAAVPAELST